MISRSYKVGDLVAFNMEATVISGPSDGMYTVDLGDEVIFEVEEHGLRLVKSAPTLPVALGIRIRARINKIPNQFLFLTSHGWVTTSGTYVEPSMITDWELS
jgi:hypothetical protein